MKKEKQKDIERKIIFWILLIVYFGSTFGQAVVAQVNLSLNSKIQRKFTNEQDMYTYLSQLSAQDKFEFLNSSSTVCTQSGDRIFSSGNRSTYKFLCFVNNNQNVNLQLTLHILNVGTNDFDFLGYTSSNDSAIRFDGYGSLKFTIFNQSRVVFSYLISAKNIVGIDADTNQGKIIILKDNSEFDSFLTNLHSTESVLFLKSAYENIFNTSSVADYSVTNIQTSDSVAQNVLTFLSSSEVFDILNGQTLQKDIDSATYSLSFDKTANKIIVKNGDQTAGTADPQMSFVPMNLPTLNLASASNQSLAQVVANSTASSVTGQFILSDFSNWLSNLFGRSVKAQESSVNTISGKLSFADIVAKLAVWSNNLWDGLSGNNLDFSNYKIVLIYDGKEYLVSSIDEARSKGFELAKESDIAKYGQPYESFLVGIKDTGKKVLTVVSADNDITRMPQNIVTSTVETFLKNYPLTKNQVIAYLAHSHPTSDAFISRVELESVIGWIDEGLVSSPVQIDVAALSKNSVFGIGVNKEQAKTLDDFAAPNKPIDQQLVEDSKISGIKIISATLDVESATGTQAANPTTTQPLNTEQLKSLVNPKSADLTVYYPASGSDIEHALTNTNGKTFVLVDNGASGLDNIGIDKVKEALNEMKATNVNLQQVSDIKITGTFNVNGEQKKLYFYFADASKFVPDEIKNGYDILYLRVYAKMAIDNPEFLPLVVSYLKLGGKLLAAPSLELFMRAQSSLSKSDYGLQLVATYDGGGAGLGQVFEKTKELDLDYLRNVQEIDTALTLASHTLDTGFYRKYSDDQSKTLSDFGDELQQISDLANALPQNDRANILAEAGQILKNVKISGAPQEFIDSTNSLIDEKLIGTQAANPVNIAQSLLKAAQDTYGANNVILVPYGSITYVWTGSSAFPWSRVSDLEFYLFVDPSIDLSEYNSHLLFNQFARKFRDYVAAQGSGTYVSLDFTTKQVGSYTVEELQDMTIVLPDGHAIPLGGNFVQHFDMLNSKERDLSSYPASIANLPVYGSAEAIVKVKKIFSLTNQDLQNLAFQDYKNVFQLAENAVNGQVVTDERGFIDGPHKVFKKAAQMAQYIGLSEAYREQVLQKFDYYEALIKQRIAQGSKPTSVLVDTGNGIKIRQTVYVDITKEIGPLVAQDWAAIRDDFSDFSKAQTIIDKEYFSNTFAEKIPIGIFSSSAQTTGTAQVSITNAEGTTGTQTSSNQLPRVVSASKEISISKESALQLLKQGAQSSVADDDLIQEWRQTDGGKIFFEIADEIGHSNIPDLEKIIKLEALQNAFLPDYFTELSSGALQQSFNELKLNGQLYQIESQLGSCICGEANRLLPAMLKEYGISAISVGGNGHTNGHVMSVAVTSDGKVYFLDSTPGQYPRIVNLDDGSVPVTEIKKVFSDSSFISQITEVSNSLKSLDEGILTTADNLNLAINQRSALKSVAQRVIDLRSDPQINILDSEQKIYLDGLDYLGVDTIKSPIIYTDEPTGTTIIKSLTWKLGDLANGATEEISIRTTDPQVLTSVKTVSTGISEAGKQQITFGAGEFKTAGSDAIAVLGVRNRDTLLRRGTLPEVTKSIDILTALQSGTNDEINSLMQNNFGTTFSDEQISVLQQQAMGLDKQQISSLATTIADDIIEGIDPVFAVSDDLRVSAGTQASTVVQIRSLSDIESGVAKSGDLVLASPDGKTYGYANIVNIDTTSRTVDVEYVVGGNKATVSFDSISANPAADMPQLLAEAGVEKITSPDVVAIGDLHGNYDGFIQLLHDSGIAQFDTQTGKIKWTGGDKILIQTGDILDRGPNAKGIMDVLMNLEKQAPGHVIVTLGNHEILVFSGDYRYVGNTFNGFGSLEEMVKQLGTDGVYGKWLRSKVVAVKIGDVVYSHAGISPEFSQYSLGQLNQMASDAIKSGNWDASIFKAGEARGGEGIGGPFWMDFNKELSKLSESQIDAILARYNAKMMVVGHTPTTTGIIVELYGGKVVKIDVGISEYYGGNQAYLTITDGAVEKNYPKPNVFQELNDREIVSNKPKRILPAEQVDSEVLALLRESVDAQGLQVSDAQLKQIIAEARAKNLINNVEGEIYSESFDQWIDQRLEAISKANNPSAADYVSRYALEDGTAKPGNKLAVLTEDGYHSADLQSYSWDDGTAVVRLDDGTIKTVNINSISRTPVEKLFAQEKPTYVSRTALQDGTAKIGDSVAVLTDGGYRSAQLRSYTPALAEVSLDDGTIKTVSVNSISRTPEAKLGVAQAGLSTNAQQIQDTLRQIKSSTVQDALKIYKDKFGVQLSSAGIDELKTRLNGLSDSDIATVAKNAEGNIAGGMSANTAVFENVRDAELGKAMGGVAATKLIPMNQVITTRSPEAVIVDEELEKIDAPVKVVRFPLVDGTLVQATSSTGRNGITLVGGPDNNGVYDLEHPVVEGFSNVDDAAMSLVNGWSSDLQKLPSFRGTYVEGLAEVVVDWDGSLVLFDFNPASVRNLFSVASNNAGFYNSNIPSAGRASVGYFHTHTGYIGDWSEGDITTLTGYYQAERGPIAGVYGYTDKRLSWGTASLDELRTFTRAAWARGGPSDLNTAAVRSTMSYLDKNQVQQLANKIVDDLRASGKIPSSTDPKMRELLSKSNKMEDQQSAEVEIVDENVPKPTSTEPILATDDAAASLSEVEILNSEGINPREISPNPQNGISGSVVETTKDVVALGDVHGYYSDAIAQLKDAGAVDAAGNIKPNVEVIQLGDIIDRAPSPAEQMDIFDWVKGGVQKGNVVYLLGNHEFGQLGGTGYGGSATASNPGMSVVKPELQALFDEGKIKLAYAENGKLYIHAGLTEELYDYIGKPQTAEEAATKLNNLLEQWKANPSDPTLTQMVKEAVWAAPEELTSSRNLGQEFALKTDLPFDEYTGHTDPSNVATIEIQSKAGPYTKQGLPGWSEVDGIQTNGNVHMIGDSIRNGENGVFTTDTITEVSSGTVSKETVSLSEQVASMSNAAKQTVAQVSMQLTDAQATTGITVLTEKSGGAASVKISVDPTVADSLAKNGGQIETTAGDVNIKITTNPTDPSVGKIAVSYKGTDLPAQDIDLTKPKTFSVDETSGMKNAALTSGEQSFADKVQSAAATAGKEVSTTINSDGTATINVIKGDGTATTGTVRQTSEGATVISVEFEGVKASATTGAMPSEFGDLAGTIPGAEVVGTKPAYIGITGNIDPNKGGFIGDTVNGVKIDTQMLSNGDVGGVIATKIESGKPVQTLKLNIENGMATGIDVLDGSGAKISTVSAADAFGTETNLAKNVETFKSTATEQFRTSGFDDGLAAIAENPAEIGGGVIWDDGVGMVSKVQNGVISNFDSEVGDFVAVSKTASAGDALAVASKFAGVTMDVLAIAGFGWQVGTIAYGYAHGQQPLGLSTPKQFQSTLSFGVGAAFAAVGVADLAGVAAVSGMMGGPVGMGAAAVAMAGIEAAPFAFANSQLGTNPLVSPTGRNIASQTLSSLSIAFSGQGTLLVNNPVFNSMYATEFVNTAKAAGGTITNDNGVAKVTKIVSGAISPYSRNAKDMPNSVVDITASVQQAASESASNDFLNTMTSSAKPTKPCNNCVEKTMYNTVGDLMTQMEGTTDQNKIQTDAVAIASAKGTVPSAVLHMTVDNLQGQIDNVQKQIDAINAQPSMIAGPRGLVPNPAKAQLSSLEQQKTQLEASQSANAVGLNAYSPQPERPQVGAGPAVQPTGSGSQSQPITFITTTELNVGSQTIPTGASGTINPQQGTTTYSYKNEAGSTITVTGFGDLTSTTTNGNTVIQMPNGEVLAQGSFTSSFDPITRAVDTGTQKITVGQNQFGQSIGLVTNNDGSGGQINSAGIIKVGIDSSVAGQFSGKTVNNFGITATKVGGSMPKSINLGGGTLTLISGNQYKNSATGQTVTVFADSSGYYDWAKTSDSTTPKPTNTNPSNPSSSQSGLNQQLSGGNINPATNAGSQSGTGAYKSQPNERTQAGAGTAVKPADNNNAGNAAKPNAGAPAPNRGAPKATINSVASEQISNFLNGLFQQFLQLFMIQQNNQSTTGSIIVEPDGMVISQK